MFGYQPKRLQRITHDPAIGGVAVEFECFEPNPKYAYGAAYKPPYAPLKPLPSHIARDAPSDCPPITPVKVMPPNPPLPLEVRQLVRSLWKRAEPAQDAQRGAVRIGNTRQADQRPRMAAIRDRAANVPYKQHVSPTKADSFNEGEMSLDWKEMEKIHRVSAYTFRGDRDGPSQLLHTRGGFKPPDTRSDRSYIEGAIYDHFADYLTRRFGTTVTKPDFLAAVNQNIKDSKTFVAYMLWRKLVDKEKFHLGRMTVDECLKAYISTSTSLPVSTWFAAGRGGGTEPGWVYVTLVHGGYSVPRLSPNAGSDNHKWATGEHEIAKLGAIDPDDIVGFRHIKDCHTLDGPIYFRPEFRKLEPHPFARIFDILSGMPQ